MTDETKQENWREIAAAAANAAGRDWIPVLIGGDQNCYSVARAIHEQYGKESYVFGRFAAGDTKYSKICHCTYDPQLSHADVLTRTVNAFAQAHADKTCLVWGCTDGYAALLMEIQDALADNCVTLYIHADLRDQLVSKAQFYKQCEKYGIPYPKTFYVDGPIEAEALTEEALGFPYPIIVKPSMSETYWEHPFPNMKKVYTAADAHEAADEINMIYAAGYPDQILLQDMIPGEDCNMRVLTAYSDQHKQVKMMCFGRVGLEEHTATALGNPCAIITEPNPEIYASVKAWLEDIGYTGFSNFDLKYDPRDGIPKVFEINLRQGRSNYYVTGAGVNIARYVVEDRILGHDLGECYYNQNEAFFHSVPAKVVYQYVKDPEFVERARTLQHSGKWSVPFYYKYDLNLNPKRLGYVQVHMARYLDKFKHSEKYT